MRSSLISLCFWICFALASADDVIDANSAAQVKMIWNYLQLRPPEIFTTTNTSTSLRSLAAVYYGDPDLISIIQESNPALPEIVTSIGKEIILPSILKCLEKYSMSCILTSYIVKGINLPELSTQSSLFPLTHPTDRGRRLAGVGDDYDLSYDEGHYLVEQFPDLRPTILRFATINQMGGSLELKDASAQSVVEARSLYWQREKIIPPKSFSRVIAFSTFENQEFLVNITIKLTPVSSFPFFYPAQQSSISATISSSYFHQETPSVFPTDGFCSILIEDPVNLNLTLSLDNDFQITTAKVIFEEYYSTVLTSPLGKITRIFPNIDTSLALQILSQPNYGFMVMASPMNQTLPTARQAWRFAPVGKGTSFFRIINFFTQQAITADVNSESIRVLAPDAKNLNQIWTLIPALNYYQHGPEFLMFYVRNKNLCWSWTEGEPTYSIALIPLRLRACNHHDTFQTFAFSNSENNKLNWDEETLGFIDFNQDSSEYYNLINLKLPWREMQLFGDLDYSRIEQGSFEPSAQNAHWILKRISDQNTYIIWNRFYGQVLSINGEGVLENQLILPQTNTGAKRQLWKLTQHSLDSNVIRIQSISDPTLFIESSDSSESGATWFTSKKLILDNYIPTIGLGKMGPMKADFSSSTLLIARLKVQHLVLLHDGTQSVLSEDPPSSMKWELKSHGNYYRIQNSETSAYLSYRSTSNSNSDEIISTTDDDDDKQIWDITVDSRYYNLVYKLQNVKSKRILTVPNGARDGIRWLVMAENAGWDTQSFKLIFV